MHAVYHKVLSAVFKHRLKHLLRPHRVLAHSVVKPLSAEIKSPASIGGNYFPGKKILGFTVKEIGEVPELCLTAIRLTHDSTGADYLHIARDDRNNVFSVAFRTTPMDSTGVPHILEHTVLCGSEKYPCRDPFFKMLNRSLATYMNALTGCDYTVYPFSTQNIKDFQNLMSVYLDAVFHPCLRKMDFRQEGWRLEHKNAHDKSSDIIFKGVVFNEMKGAFTNSDQLFAQKMLNSILPGHTYAHVSGGDPLHIPDLSWKQLCEFHSSHYHPSNAKFYTYGDFPIENHLKQINEELKNFSRIPIDTSVPAEKRWNEPRTLKIHCRPDPLLPNPDKNTTVCRSYLLTGITDNEELFTLQILSALLVDGPNSPFYKNLLEPQIGSNYAPVTGIDASIKEAIFSIGLQGIHPDESSRVLKIIDDTFDETIRSGFPSERIDAFLHRIELAMKHVTTSFGLNLGLGLMATWIHDGDPIAALKLNLLIQNFREKLKKNPKYLQQKISKYFKDNNHYLTLTMTPDENYEHQQNKKEGGKLASYLSSLTDKDKEQIYEKGLQLERNQNQEVDVSSLPSLKISDIDPLMKFSLIKSVEIDGVNVQCTAQPTNGVTHFRGIIDVKDLPVELKPYLPLFCSVLTSLGAGDMDYRQLSQRIELKTGGLNVSTHVSENPFKTNDFEEGIRLYSHCLDHNATDMFWLWNEVLQRVKFDDKDRLATLISMIATDTVSSIPDSGHSYAISQANSTLSAAASLRDQFHGMKQVSEIRKLAELSDLEEVICNLQKIAQQILKKSNFRFSLNASESSLSNALKKLDELISHLPNISGKGMRDMTGRFQPASNKCYYVLPFPVHYVGHCLLGVPFVHQDYASLKVLAQLMTNKFLHKEIREKGGAYGGGASHGSSGIFTFYSYRDPNSIQTLDVFDKAVFWAQEGQYTNEHIDEAKLTVFQSVDKPIAPGNVGDLLFSNRISEKMVQEHRQQLFKVNKSDLIKVTSQYLVHPKHVGTCILGPENANVKSDPIWKIITEYREL